MQITNEVVEYQKKYYARTDFVIGDKIPPKSICRDKDGFGSFYGFNLTFDAPVPYTESTEKYHLVYIPIQVPEGYPNKWAVLKDGDIIDKHTISYERNRLGVVGDHTHGEYSEVCQKHHLWSSYLMFNPVKKRNSAI